MESGLSSQKGKAVAMKKKYRPIPYNDPEIFLRDPDVHISNFAFNREVLSISSIHAHGSESIMMINDVSDECDKCRQRRSGCVSCVLRKS